MWPFGKKKVIDFTQQVKIARKIQPSSAIKAENSDYNELANESALGFLGNLASSGTSSSGNSGKEELSIQHLKVKLEDSEYKLENLSRKINALLDRVDLVEKKVDRNNRFGA